jgi:hypothetical protein
MGEARNIHRRMLLIRPDVNLPHPGDSDYGGTYYLRVPAAGPTMGGPTNADVVQAYYELMQISDVSVRPFLVPMSNYVYFMANSLADLTHRGNRFMNLMDVPGLGTPFPNMPALNPHFGGDTTIDPWHPNNDTSLYRWLLNDARRGEDVIASNVLAFDVRVYDPLAVLRSDTAGAVILQPGDPGYDYAIANNYAIQGSGAFVDLFYSRYLPSMVIPAGSAQTFAHPPTLKSQFGTVAVYDTWSTRYERDGVNQDISAETAAGQTPLVDEGTNGVDDDNQNGVDDVSDNLPALRGENETLPPYPQPLRGIEVRVRIYEPGSRQAQQATVSADFVPE